MRGNRYFLTDSDDFINMSFESFERTVRNEPARKERINRPMLEKDIVIEIFNSKEKSTILAQKYGVTNDVVNKIRRKETYRKYLE